MLKYCDEFDQILKFSRRVLKPGVCVGFRGNLLTEMEFGALNVRIVVFLLPQNLGSHNDDDVSIENLKKKKKSLWV